MSANDFKAGDSIYYYDSDRSGWPGEVIAIRRRIKVRINHYNGDREIWVKPSKLEHQGDQL